MRHSNKILFWIAQTYDHVDKRLRDQTDLVISCECMTAKKQLKVKFYLGFERETYEQFQAKKLTWSSSKALIKKLFGAKFRFLSFPDYYDRLLFTVYNSFDRDLTTGDPVMSNPPNLLKFKKTFRRVNFSESEFDERYQQRFPEQQEGVSLKRRVPLAGGARRVC